MKWFRFYSDALNNPKVQRLPGDLYKTWVNLLCLANEQDERGTLPKTVEDIAWALRMDVDTLRNHIHTLQGQRLLDWDEAAQRYVPHDWHERQKPSDDVTARVQKHRESNKEGETLHVTTMQRSSNALDKNREDKNRLEEIREEEKKPARASAVRSHSYPDNFVVTEEMTAKARAKYPGLDVEYATEEWSNAMRANRAKYKYTDWEQAWMNGMGRAAKWQAEQGGKGNGSNGKPTLSGVLTEIFRGTGDTDQANNHRRLPSGGQDTAYRRGA